MRVEFFGDEIDRITEIDVLTGEIKGELEHVAIFPASHYVVPARNRSGGLRMHIEEELEERVQYFKSQKISCWRHRGLQRGPILILKCLRRRDFVPGLKTIPGICRDLLRDSLRIH